MIRFSQFFLAFTVAVLLVWQLPWCYAFLSAKATRSAFVLYSPLIDDFISISYSDSLGAVVRSDRQGHQYTQAQTDSLLPFFYLRQLMTDQRFPDSICGRAIDPQQVQASRFSFRTAPIQANAHAIALYPLLESHGSRVDLEMPGDVMRFTNHGVEFIDMGSNRVDTIKSQVFSAALLSAGFAFPASCVTGNPVVKKEYDEGYLVTDCTGALFHLKMVDGQPWVHPISLPDGVDVQPLAVTEYKDHRTLGLLVDNEQQLWVLSAGTYLLTPTEVAFCPSTDAMTIQGNLLDWTVTVRTDEANIYYALRADDYSLIRKYSVPSLTRTIPGLAFTDPDDPDVRPRL